MKMLYDKESGHIGYNDEAHIYQNKNTGGHYKSVTTLLGEFKPKFDAYYWSAYKACKDCMEEEGSWYAYKKRAGGWESVVPYFNANYKELDKQLYGRIQKKQQEYKQKWAREGRIANVKGSKIHEDLEGAAHHARIMRQGEHNFEVSQETILQLQDFESNKCYPELLIYNDEYQIAGQADQVFKQGRWVDVEDFKTYKRLEEEGFRGEMMLEPLGHIPNANYWGTALQLSMYGYMLEELGYKVRSLRMHWIHGKDEFDKERNAGVRTYEMPYMKDDIIRLLNY